MKSDEFTLDVVLASELKYAFRRNGYTVEQIKKLTQGDLLDYVREVLEEKARIVRRTEIHVPSIVASPAIESTSNFPDQVIIGLLRNWETAVAALKAAGRQVSPYALHPLQQMEWVQEPRVIKTGRWTVGERGFTSRTRYDHILEETGGTGKAYLAEVAVMIAITYTRQLLGKVTRMAMPTILSSGRYPHIFCFGRHEDGLWFSARCTRPESEFDLDCEFASEASS